MTSRSYWKLGQKLSTVPVCEEASIKGAFVLPQTRPGVAIKERGGGGCLLEATPDRIMGEWGMAGMLAGRESGYICPRPPENRHSAPENVHVGSPKLR